ncbi:MAG: hypothetical protein H7124_15165 [Phycisphaerales bacterium]|nr:hypothetical protein [Hyphomonadaceae bacterium]
MNKSFTKALAFIGALLCAPLATAQTVGGPIQVRTGDAFTVHMEYTQAMDIGEQHYDATMRQVYSVHVLDAESRLWRFMPMSLSYELPNVPNMQGQAANINWPAMSDAMSAMMRIATDVGFDCRVDDHGRCVEMTNWPFWSARAENLVMMADGFARMAPRRAASGADAPPPPSDNRTKQDPGELSTTEEAEAAPNWETLRGPVLQGVARLIDGFDSRDAASSMSGIYIPAFVQGRTLTRRQTVNFTDEYEMPFGAPPLRYNGTLRLDRIDRAANTAIVTRRAALDQESARATIRAMTEFVSAAMIEPLAPHYPEGQQPPDAAGIVTMLDTMLAGFNYEDTTRGVIDLTTGLARETTTDFTLIVSMVATEEPLVTRGRIVTRVTPGAPETPRLPRG